MPKLSIITINYNNLAGLQRTVESVLNQTWQEFEYIVIDGGSSDGSVAYLENIATHLDYWISEPDTGIYNAMNKGIRKATGEYLLFLNSGDHLYSSNVLFENHEFLKDKDIVYFDLMISELNHDFKKVYPEKLTFQYFIKDSLPHPATFIRATLFDGVGFYDENIKIVADWKFFMTAICKYSSSYLKINQTMSVFYLDGLSSVPENRALLLKERDKVLKEDFAFFIHDAEELNYLRGAISNLRKSNKMKWLIKLGLVDPF